MSDNLTEATRQYAARCLPIIEREAQRLRAFAALKPGKVADECNAMAQKIEDECAVTRAFYRL